MRREKKVRKLVVSRETLKRLTIAELDGVAGGAEKKRGWLTAWTCRSCPDVSCACDA